MDADLPWLPACAEWSDLLSTAREQEPLQAFQTFIRLANCRMDFVRANRLDKAVQRYSREHGVLADLPRIKLALLGSSTLSHLSGGIRLGSLRRGLFVDLYESPYGQYRQELASPESGLHAFAPDVLCFAFDAQHIAGAESATSEAALSTMRDCWTAAQSQLGCTVIQQTVLPRLPRLLGNEEAHLPGSPARIIEEVNCGLRTSAATCGVHLLTVDTWAAQEGLSHWHDATLWFASKQEIHPRSSSLYGDQLGRLLGALRGRSSKCLVLDLDNTLWGGIIGDDGLSGIILGQGSATAEAYTALQRYALQLSRRGVILAVCSKNDEANALAVFDSHPEMVLRRADISCFVANWRDKATNLREIATRLNLGLDSLVFVDDNPAERALIRRELPMVAVPELPDDPSGYVETLAHAGYFEAVLVSGDDRERTAQYRANAEREKLRHTATDLEGYLNDLRMELTCTPFQKADLGRIVQLINKTNQFNLTTERLSEIDVARLMRDHSVVTLQLRLVDVYGDNGIISLLIAHEEGDEILKITTWLMSCRVLGRQVESAALNVLATVARELNCNRILGTFRPSPKNDIVREHYGRLGFKLESTASDGTTTWLLSLDQFNERPTPMRVMQGESCIPVTCIGN